jgi:hypothetical protein
VTVFHPQAAVMTAVVDLRGPVWIEAHILAIRALSEEAVAVVVKTADGERNLSVAWGKPDLLAVLGRGFTASEGCGSLSATAM